ncbi:glycosyltransferase [Herbiconiux sp. KACC 21604]|uniref:glycosyltransferase n=1 Tax=unclassified Herbiconiux TaxID=2618217 RepID=UPI0014914F6C|nr:glycosyltransferase [Herbiconiux sp. SALV-R1]QJU54643.1 glycosyl transferase [Herbiconiux sp. SALV-R1]WPO85742.1 glycosyltransferase [Herbiconiux sp. KACC 21604]
MIGYYVHHVGQGHAVRATAIAAHLDEPVTGLSSLPKPAGWRGPWVQLPLDDTEPVDRSTTDADGRLHWVPLRHEGLRKRMARIAAWIDRAGPSALVSDVSVEVALLARLHGVPVVSFALPGRRDDEAHRLGFAASSLVLSAWPAEAEGMLDGLDEAARSRHVPVGAISRFATAAGKHARPFQSAAPKRRPRVLVLNGRGGGGVSDDALERARRAAPGWDWTLVGGEASWVDDPWPLLRRTDVVVTHAGQGAIADVSAARRPAVVIPQNRPHDEQRHTAAVLAAGEWPAVVTDSFDTADWGELLTEACERDGAAWRTWNDGRGAARAAAAIATVASGGQAVASAHDAGSDSARAAGAERAAGAGRVATRAAGAERDAAPAAGAERAPGPAGPSDPSPEPPVEIAS